MSCEFNIKNVFEKWQVSGGKWKVAVEVAVAVAMVVATPPYIRQWQVASGKRQVAGGR